EFPVQAMLMLGRGAEAVTFQSGMRPALRVELAEQRVGRLACASSSEQQPIAAVRFDDFPPPGLRCAEASQAGSPGERFGHKNLSALGPQGALQPGNKLRRQCIDGQKHMCGMNTAAV